MLKGGLGDGGSWRDAAENIDNDKLKDVLEVAEATLMKKGKVSSLKAVLLRGDDFLAASDKSHQCFGGDDTKRQELKTDWAHGWLTYVCGLLVVIFRNPKDKVEVRKNALRR